MASSANSARSRATVLGAFLEGWRRVLRAPAIAASVLIVTFLLAVPLALTLNSMLVEHLGASLEADRATWAWDEGWATEFQQQAQGLGRTFTHEILDFGGTIKILSDLLDRQALNPALAGAVSAYLLLWLFLSGGILDRYARGRPLRTAAFFAACGVYFVRFFRLAIVMAAAYAFLFWVVHPFLFSTIYPRLVRDMTAEGPAVLLRLGFYAVFGLLLMLTSLVFDYTKVRAVVEDRRSMLVTMAASVRFIRRRVWRTFGLYLLNGLAFVIVIRLWYDLAPAAYLSIWLSFLLTQIYLLLRVWAKLAFLSSEVVFFQGELAHAGYTAAPPQQWPESASAEAIRNLSVQTSPFEV